MRSDPSDTVVYLSPRGRRCMLVLPGRPRAWLEFRYLDNASLAGGGFYLRHELFHRVMRVAAPAGGIAVGVPR